MYPWHVEQQRPLRWLFLDLNSYFASVEQQLRPELRGMPVGIVPVEADTTCCIAASYEAKAHGVRTGTSVREARRLCPDIRLIPARPKLYVEYHHKIVAAVWDCVPVTAVMSIDEMACRLLGRERDEEQAQALARKIKETIYQRAGEMLRCSIGLAPNRFLAKVATELQKPDGLVVVRPQDLPEILHPLELSDLPGIGRNMLQRLNRNGIYSVRQLCALSKEDMTRIWRSVIGTRFWHWLRGDDIAEPPVQRRSVGHSHRLPPDLRTEEGVFAVAKKLLHKAAARLRRLEYYTKGIGVSVRFYRGDRWKAHLRIAPTQDTLTLTEALLTMWRDKPHASPDAVSVVLYDLVPVSACTLSLFRQEKREKLSHAIDAINDRFGNNSVWLGSTHTIMQAAPTRISFTSIPDLDTF